MNKEERQKKIELLKFQINRDRRGRHCKSRRARAHSEAKILSNLKDWLKQVQKAIIVFTKVVINRSSLSTLFANTIKNLEPLLEHDKV